MSDVPEMRFGSAVAKSPDWRKSSPDETPDDDEELAETPSAVVAMLGFDPKSED